MTINVQLQYHTNWGESVQLRIGKRRIPMEYSFGGLWQIMLTGRDLHHGDEFTYEVVRDGKVVQREWRTHHFKAPQATISRPRRPRKTLWCVPGGCPARPIRPFMHRPSATLSSAVLPACRSAGPRA